MDVESSSYLPVPIDVLPEEMRRQRALDGVRQANEVALAQLDIELLARAAGQEVLTSHITASELAYDERLNGIIEEVVNPKVDDEKKPLVDLVNRIIKNPKAITHGVPDTAITRDVVAELHPDRRTTDGPASDGILHDLTSSRASGNQRRIQALYARGLAERVLVEPDLLSTDLLAVFSYRAHISSGVNTTRFSTAQEVEEWKEFEVSTASANVRTVRLAGIFGVYIKFLNPSDTGEIRLPADLDGMSVKQTFEKVKDYLDVYSDDKKKTLRVMSEDDCDSFDSGVQALLDEVEDFIKISKKGALIFDGFDIVGPGTKYGRLASMGRSLLALVDLLKFEGGVKPRELYPDLIGRIATRGTFGQIDIPPLENFNHSLKTYEKTKYHKNY